MIPFGARNIKYFIVKRVPFLSPVGGRFYNPPSICCGDEIGGLQHPRRTRITKHRLRAGRFAEVFFFLTVVNRGKFF